MKLNIQIRLLSDSIFGNGMSMPGGEDICILTDEQGFPYMKGSTLKGIFREELINYLDWNGEKEAAVVTVVKRLMGEEGANMPTGMQGDRLIFSDATLHDLVIRTVREEKPSKQEVMDMFSYTREFTRLENGMTKSGSFRSARCIKKGLDFYATCSCAKEDAQLVENVLVLVKWIGSMRNRGFGRAQIKVEVQVDE